VSLLQVSESLSFPGDAGLGMLLPYLAGLAVEQTVVAGDLVTCWVRARAAGAFCPGCGTWSQEEHDSYRRRLGDAGIGGRRVVLRLRTRLLECANPGCPKGTFAEQPEGLAGPRARKTGALREMLQAMAAALAGRAGARLSRAVLAVEVSRHFLVRLIMAAPEPGEVLVRVLGVDDFSLLKGRSYATVLVDMEAGVPVDVLPDREAGTFADWLRAHPEVEIICRDRGGAYAEAARSAAPDAVQAADRWHLWHNLCEHVRDAAARHRDCLAGHCSCGIPEEQAQREERERAGREEAERAKAASAEPAAVETRIRDRHAEVTALRGAGLDLPAAAAELGLQRRIARRYWNAPTADALLAGLRGTPGLDRWKPLLLQEWAAGNTSITALHKSAAAAGFTGSHDCVARFLAPYRLAAPGKPPAPPASRQVARWITSPPDKLGSDETAALDAITARCPDLAALQAHVTAFAEILTQREGKDALDAWLAAAGTDPAQPELASFANGIRLDYQAVANGLTLPWNSGLVEGLNTRTKLLKRQMYGRATFLLLRKRILTTS
jgi:transposase